MAAERIGELRFRAMGSDAHVLVVGGADPQGRAHAARNRIEELEARWSRFRPDSEISELNRRAGTPVTVSADTVLLVERAIEAWRMTGGAVDPTVLGAVVAAGYDRPFDQLPGDRRSAAAPAAPALAAFVGCTDIVIAGETVTVPAGTGFDPGGMGKGLAADLVLDALLGGTLDDAEPTAGEPVAGACVNLGGDLRVAGLGPAGAAWTVAIEEPASTTTIALIGLVAGAVATSTTARRAWLLDGRPQHHLIDPATGRPTTSDLVQVSVIAPEAWVAEAYAKAVLLRGSDGAFDRLPAGVEALAVRDDGQHLVTAGWRDFAGRPRA